MSSITESLATKIITTHLKADAEKDAAIHHGRRALSAAWECGQYLIQAATANKGKWKEWFDANIQNHATGSFSYKTATNYMKLSSKFPTLESLKGLNTHQLKDGYVACGIMPEPERGEPQDSHEPTHESSFVSYAGKLTGAINRSLERSPLSEWDIQEKIALKATLKPLADLYAQL